MTRPSCRAIDALTHLTPGGGWFNTSLDASEDSLLRQMDETGIEQSIVAGLAGLIPNDFVLSTCERHRDRLLPVASFNPVAYTTSQEAITEARSQLMDQGFVGLKLHPRLNRYDPLAPQVLSLLDEIASWTNPLPIWLCTYFHYQGGSLGKPLVETVYEMVGRYPGIRFILVHAGGPDVLRLAHAVRHCSNVWLDLSYTISIFSGSSVQMDIHYLMQTFEQRLIFGSDFPEISQMRAISDLHNLATDAKPGALEVILGENLRRAMGQAKA